MSYTRARFFALCLAAASAAVLLASPALADDDDKEESKSESEAKTEASGNVSLSGKPLSSTTDSDSDHALYVGAFAVGYLGASEIPFVQPNSVSTTTGQVFTMQATGTTLNAPVIGMRYWISDLLGIDAGIGLRSYSGSIKRTYADIPNQITQDVKEDKINQFGLLIHLGVPLCLHAEKHWAFQIIPEMNVGISSGTIQDPRKFSYYGPNDTPPVYLNDIKLSGMRFDLGARAGTELHFGFIGVPNLSLQASIGLYLRYDKFQAKGGGLSDGTTPDTAVSDTNMTWGTSVYDAPWSIFTKNVAALYYF